MIDLDRVSVSYNDRRVLSDVSMSLPRGSFHFLTGPSGAGKTTLLKLCYLERAPDAGRVKLFGSTVRADDCREGVSWRGTHLHRYAGVQQQESLSKMSTKNGYSQQNQGEQTAGE